MKRIGLIIAILFLLQMLVNGQTSSKLQSGFEVDALPYLTGGYYGSVWLGYNKMRFRAVITDVNTPDFYIPDGFEDLSTNAYTLIVDYFPFKEGDSFKGLWFGLGAEYWKNSVENSVNNISGEYESLILTAGSGYVISLWRNLYVNPWCAVHYGATGMEKLNIGGKEYNPRKVTPEASIKFGWSF